MLALRQLRVEDLRHRAGAPLARAVVSAQAQHRAGAALGVVFEGLPRQPMLQEGHGGAPRIGRDSQGPAFPEVAPQHGAGARRPGVSIRLRIRIAAPVRRVVCLEAAHEAAGLLIERGGHNRGRSLPVAAYGAVADGDLVLPVARLVAVAARGRAEERDAAPFAAASEPPLDVFVGPRFHAAAPAVHGRASDHVDDAMQRVAAEQAARGAAHDFHGSRLLGVHLEQVVDVAETSWANRNAVLEQQEPAAGAGAGQHAGANRGEVFLPGPARDPHPRHAHEDLVRMVGAHQRHVFAIHRGQAAHRPLVGGDGRLSAHDDFLQRVLVVGCRLRSERRRRDGCQSGKGTTPQLRSCVAHPHAVRARCRRTGSRPEH